MAELIPLDEVLFLRNLEALHEDISRHRSPHHGQDSPPPSIVVVSKYLNRDDARRLRQEGVGPLGENRAHDLCAKTDSGEDREGWHFIGHLQRNKISRIVPRISLLHSVDSARLAEAVDSWVEEHSERPCRCLVQVNVSGEGTKGGLPPSEARVAIPAWTEQFTNLRIEGLMTMAPLVDAETCRPIFRAVRELRDEIRESLAPEFGERFRELSMGMSNDYPVAVEEGATLLRIGRRLFR